jgi:prolipoprotein diacylglyceryltransferase
MYPNLYYAFQDLFGVHWRWLRFVNSFGFFVALAFLAAAWVLVLELKRKERAGLLSGQEAKIIVGKPASVGEILLNGVLGFLLGFKIIGLFVAPSALTEDPQQFIVSENGYWPAGIALGLFFAVFKWFDKNKHKLPKPEERTIRIWPHDRVGDLVIYAALFGFLGAKIFHNLENWDDFQKHPLQALISFSGLTFYGGLICAAVAIWFYAKKHKIGFIHLCDAAAPALILAYAIGRIGCQVAGDGDWGILNSAYITVDTGKIKPADSTEIQNTLANSTDFYFNSFKVNNLADVPRKSVTGPSWIPRWMIAYSYPHNVVSDGVHIPNCTSDNPHGDPQYCNQLPIPVFPTPFYETVTCLLLFAFLWAMRGRLKIPGTMFAVYLIVNGLERFFVEKIRVNTKYDIFGFRPTQAEIISTLLVIGGIALFLIVRKRNSRQPQQIAP